MDGAVPLSESQRDRTTAEGAAAGGERGAAGEGTRAAPAVIEALTAAGIGEPKRAELVAICTGLEGAVETIRRTADSMRARGKNAGAIIRELEALADKARLESRRQANQAPCLNEQQRAARDHLRQKYGM